MKLSNKPTLLWKIASRIADPYVDVQGRAPQSSLSLIGGIRLKIAINLLKRLSRKSKGDTSLFLLGKCYQALGNYEQALIHFKRTWETSAFSPILLKEICTACLDLEKYEEGLQYALKEVSEFPRNAEAKANLAYFLYKNNRNDEAKKVVAEAYEMDKGNQYVSRIYNGLTNKNS